MSITTPNEQAQDNGSTDTPVQDTATVDQRRKIDHDKVLELRSQGVKAKEIAKQGLASDGEEVAIGTIYKIIREAGMGSGRTIDRAPRGVNVASGAEAYLNQLRSVVTGADEAKVAMQERHTQELASLDSETASAREALKVMEELAARLAPPVSENGDAPENAAGAPTEVTEPVDPTEVTEPVDPTEVTEPVDPTPAPVKVQGRGKGK